MSCQCYSSESTNTKLGPCHCLAILNLSIKHAPQLILRPGFRTRGQLDSDPFEFCLPRCQLIQYIPNVKDSIYACDLMRTWFTCSETQFCHILSRSVKHRSTSWLWTLSSKAFWLLLYLIRHMIVISRTSHVPFPSELFLNNHFHSIWLNIYFVSDLELFPILSVFHVTLHIKLLL